MSEPRKEFVPKQLRIDAYTIFEQNAEKQEERDVIAKLQQMFSEGLTAEFSTFRHLIDQSSFALVELPRLSHQGANLSCHAVVKKFDVEGKPIHGHDVLDGFPHINTNIIVIIAFIHV